MSLSKPTSLKKSIVLLAAIFIGLGFAWYLKDAWISPVQVSPGTEIVSVLEDEVMTIIYQTTQGTLTAQRSRPGAQFAIQLTFVDGRTPQQCVSQTGLENELKPLTTLIAKQQITRDEYQTRFPVPLGILELRSRMTVERSSPITLSLDSGRRSMAASYDGLAFELSNPPEAFVNLASGCAVLAKH